MSQKLLSVGDRVRIRPASITVDVYGRVTSMHSSAAAIECRSRDRGQPPITAGDEAEVTVFAPSELRVFTAKILADKGLLVAVTVPSVDNPVARHVHSCGGYRKTCDAEAICSPTSEPTLTFKARIENVSIGGLLLVLDRDVDLGGRLGGRLIVRFGIPGSTYDFEGIIEVMRMIPNSHCEDGMTRVGCAFTSVSRTCIARLKQFVEEDATQTAPSYGLRAG